MEAKFNLPVKEKLKRLSAYRGSWRARARARKRISLPPDIFKSPAGLDVNYRGLGHSGAANFDAGAEMFVAPAKRASIGR